MSKRELTVADVPPHLRGAISPERWAKILAEDAAMAVECPNCRRGDAEGECLCADAVDMALEESA